MTKVSLNPDHLQTFITSLNDLADAAETAKNNIDNEIAAEGEPLNPFPSDEMMRISTAIENVRNRASELDDCKRKIVEVNESGVGTMDADGAITLEVSDDINTEEEMASWAQGSKDGADLVAIRTGKTPESKRTYEEVMASIRDNQAGAAYAEGVIDSIGVENLTNFPFRGSGDVVSDQATEIAETLGTLLASASRRWSKERAESVAETLAESVDGDVPNEYGHITVLNAMLGGHDADGDHVNDLKFNRYLLIGLAEHLDDIDLDDVTAEMHKSQFYSRAGMVLPDGCTDPMAGVLDAMGNNRFAALGYLAPTANDGSVDTSRVDALAGRKWDSTGLAGFAGAVAAASCLRTSALGAQSERAAQLAGHAIHGLGSRTGDKTDLYNDDAKARVGVLLANCPDEVTAAWGDGIHGVDGNPDALISRSTAEQLGNATVRDLDALASTVADNADATGTISAGLASYASKRSHDGVSSRQDDPNQQVDAIADAYGRGAAAEAHLVGIADSRAKDKTAADISRTDELNGSANTAISASSTVLAGGLSALPPPAGTASSTAVSAGGTILAPVAADALVDDPQAARSPVSLKLTDAMMAAAAQDAAHAGLINQDSYQVGPTANDPDVQTAADRYAWVVDDGQGGHTIDLSKTPKENLAGVDAWMSQVTDDTRLDAIPPDSNLSRLQDAINKAVPGGYVSGSSSAVGHDDEG